MLDTVAQVPSARVLAMIDETRAVVVRSATTDGLIALALVGSASRGEETWAGSELVSDIDVTAIVRTVDPRIHRRFDALAKSLPAGISIGSAPLYSLDRYRTLDLFSSQRDGWVFWGDRAVFGRVRIRSAADVPRWEAPRLALNRSVDFLRADAGLVPPWYAAVKMYLALGEAELILAGAYDPSYRVQREAIGRLDTVLGDADLRDRIMDALAVKLDAIEPHMLMDDSSNRAHAILGLESLFSRYLAQPVDTDAGLEMMARGHRSMPHRAYYLARNRRRPDRWRRALVTEPIFWFWATTLDVVRGRLQLDPSQLAEFLDDFKETHQPLVR
jgi:hypothetical protein